jgi:acyl carrier protein phosphodiesterase
LNHLAHLFLSDPTDGCRLGALMGDYVKGRLDDRYSGEIRWGLQLHRKIDRFAETNPHFQRSKRRLDPALRHCRGILVDVAYDHFLAVHWLDFADSHLEQFAANIYHLLTEHHPLLPPALQEAAPRMVAADWLVAARHLDTVDKVLQRLAGRLSRSNNLGSGLVELTRHYPLLEADFRQFLHDACGYIKTLKP